MCLACAGGHEPTTMEPLCVVGSLPLDDPRSPRFGAANRRDNKSPSHRPSVLLLQSTRSKSTYQGWLAPIPQLTTNCFFRSSNHPKSSFCLDPMLRRASIVASGASEPNGILLLVACVKMGLGGGRENSGAGKDGSRRRDTTSQNGVACATHATKQVCVTRMARRGPASSRWSSTGTH